MYTSRLDQSRFGETPPAPKLEQQLELPTTSSETAAPDTNASFPIYLDSLPPSSVVQAPSVESASATASTPWFSPTQGPSEPATFYGFKIDQNGPTSSGLKTLIEKYELLGVKNNTSKDAEEPYTSITVEYAMECPPHLAISTPSYTEDCFQPKKFKEVVDGMVKRLEPYRGTFDAIAACGNSGITMASVISYLMEVPMTVVRKERDRNNHHGQDVTGYLGSGKYIIIDDLISSGETLRWILTEINKAAVARYSNFIPPTCSGIFLYHSPKTEWSVELRKSVPVPFWKYDRQEIPIHFIGPERNRD